MGAEWKIERMEVAQVLCCWLGWTVSRKQMLEQIMARVVTSVGSEADAGTDFDLNLVKSCQQ